MNTKERLHQLRELDFDAMAGKPESAVVSQYKQLNYLDVSPDDPIYRIFSFPRLLQAVQQSELVLVRPQKWDDPYENFILNASATLTDGTTVSFAPLRNAFYGQCWSLRRECDGLWKAFSGSETTVKVASTPRKLMDYFYDATNPFHSLSYFIGKVEYVPDEKIRAFFESRIDWMFHDGGQGLSLIQTLLIKREAFSYEEEIRLLFHAPNSDQIDPTKILNPWDLGSDLFQFQIDPNTVIDEIVFSPTTDTKTYRRCKSQLLTAGFTGTIRRSQLYDKPNFVARL